jgi:hypothetical protein
MGLRRLVNAPEVNVVLFALLLHLPWEFWQVPYFEGMAAASHWAAVKVCTQAAAGDALIALGAFLIVALALKNRRWILAPSWRGVLGYIAGGLVVTVVIERLSTAWGRWTYGEAMPIVPVLEVGLLPVLQWLVLPPLTVWFVRRQLRPSRPE